MLNELQNNFTELLKQDNDAYLILMNIKVFQVFENTKIM